MTSVTGNLIGFCIGCKIGAEMADHLLNKTSIEQPKFRLHIYPTDSFFPVTQTIQQKSEEAFSTLDAAFKTLDAEFDKLDYSYTISTTTVSETHTLNTCGKIVLGIASLFCTAFALDWVLDDLGASVFDGGLA